MIPLLILIALLRPLVPGLDQHGLQVHLLSGLIALAALLRWRSAPATCVCGAPVFASAGLLLVLLASGLRSLDQAASLHLICGWLLDGVFLACCLDLPGATRRRLLNAFLVGLAVHALLACGQALWAFPAMHEAVAGLPHAAALRERLSAGGVYGLFDQANSLANALLPALVLVLAGTQRRHPWVGLGTALLLGGAVFLSANKGAWVCLMLAGLLLWAARGPAWRWLLPISTLGLVPLLSTLPSIAVRLDYWRMATALWLEAPLVGHGLDGYHRLSPLHHLAQSEPSRFAHSLPGDLAVATGAIGLLVLTLWVLTLVDLLRRAPCALQASAPEPADAQRALIGAAAVLVVGLLGGFTSDNLAFWPGHHLLWLPVLAGLAGLGLWLSRTWQYPAKALRLALLALLLQWLIDATWANAVLPCLAGLLALQMAPSERALQLPARAVAAVVLAVGVVAAAGSMGIGNRRLAGTVLLNDAQHAASADQQQALVSLAVAEAERFPRDFSLLLSALRLQDPARSAANIPAGDHHLLWSLRARAAAANDALAQAIAAQQQAVAEAPIYLPHRLVLVELLLQRGDRAAARAEIATLDQLRVHPANALDPRARAHLDQLRALASGTDGAYTGP